VNRFLYATLTGLWFHLLYHSFDLKVLDWKAFLIFDLIFVATLIYHEKITYTRPIKVSDHSSLTPIANDMAKRAKCENQRISDGSGLGSGVKE
jgi:hypothetical protein